MEEKSYYSNLKHVVDSTTVGDSNSALHILCDANGGELSIKIVREAIGTGQITAAADLANAYNLLTSWTEYPHFFPLIGFSLMYFVPGTSEILKTTLPVDGWTNRWNNITLAYSYLFITLLIALVALAMLLINGIKDIAMFNKNKKMDVITIPVKNFSYFDFTMKNVTEFIINLTLIFAFFSFISTCIVIIYWIFLYIFKGLLKLASRNKFKIDVKEFEIGKNDLFYLIGVMIFQNTYTIVKSYFTNNFGVNLDIIMQIILPIGTVTVIIGLFIKNLMSSKINGTKKTIASIGDTIAKIQTFIALNGKKALQSFEFVQILPSWLQKSIREHKMADDKIIKILDKCQIVVEYIEENFKKNVNDKNYLLYIAYYKCQDFDTLNTFYANIQKVVNYQTRSTKPITVLPSIA